MQATRKRIIRVLKEHGEATVEDLAKAVGLTQMAVRHHLNVLQAEQLISAPAVRRSHKRGRPQQVYALTDAADKLFPEDYFQLADYLLDELTEQVGHQGVVKVFENIASRLLSEAPPRKAGQPFEDRLEQLVDFMSDKGFVVHWERHNDTYSIQVISCPYRQVARDHSEVCLLDKHIIASMLNVQPRRVTCMAQSDERCTYQFQESQSIPLLLNE